MDGHARGDVVTIRCAIQNDFQNRFKPRPAVIMEILGDSVLIVPLSCRSGHAVGTYIDATEQNGLQEQSIALVLDRQSRPVHDIRQEIGCLEFGVFERLRRDCGL